MEESFESEKAWGWERPTSTCKQERHNRVRRKSLLRIFSSCTLGSTSVTRLGSVSQPRSFVAVLLSTPYSGGYTTVWLRLTSTLLWIFPQSTYAVQLYTRRLCGDSCSISGHAEIKDFPTFVKLLLLLMHYSLVRFFHIGEYFELFSLGRGGGSLLHV